MAVLTLAAGCNPSYILVPSGTALGADPRQRVQVFTHERILELHSLRVSPDSLSGVPFFQPPGCAACRVSIARAAVDSVRVVNPKDDTPFYVGLGVIAVLFLMFNVCQPGGCVPGR